MNFGEIPVVENAFSLPRDVFERVWSSQQRVSNASSTATSCTRNPASANTTGQFRRLSGDYVTELTGSKAKRPCLSISEQAVTQKEHLQREQQKQLKLQLIMQRLDNTREKVLRLLQLQNARERSRQDANLSEQSIELERFQRRYVLLKRRAHALNSLRGSLQEKGKMPPLQPQFQGSRRVPGISLVTSGAWSSDQRSGYFYNSFESAGLALDHGTYPKIVAVHSVMDTAAVNAVHHLYEQKDKPVSVSVSRKPLSDYVYDKNNVEKNGSCSPFTKDNTLVGNFRTHEGEEVVLTKVIPGKSRSTGALSYKERKHDELNLANCKQHARSNNKHSLEHVDVPGDATLRKDQQEIVDHPGDIGQAGIVSHPGHAAAHEEHTEHVNQSGNVDNQVSKDNTQTKQAELSQKQQHDFSLELSKNADSDMYLGGPPPYLPVLGMTEVMEREKEMNPERPVSSASSPRLAKTVLEISEKIIQTRERIKNETIDWKKCVLFKLEKRLIQKLRRAERLTGEKTEIEDLREEVSLPVTDGKKGKGQGQRRRNSRKESLPECATDGDAGKSQGQESSLSRQSSVSHSVTDYEPVDCHGQEKRSSVSDSVTNEVIGDECESEQMRNNQLDHVTNCVMAEDEERPECPQKQEKEGHSVNRPTEYPQREKVEDNSTCDKEMQCNYLTEKRNNAQNVKISFAQKRNIELSETLKSIEKYEVDQANIRCEGFKSMLNMIDNQINTDEQHEQVDAEATNTISNCLIVEHSQASALHMKRESNFIDTESIKRQKTELRHENSEKQLQYDEVKKECVTVGNDARENHRPKERKNLFENFRSRFQASVGPKKDAALLVTNKESRTNSSVFTAEKNDPDKKVGELFKSTTCLNKKLQSCGKEKLDTKSVTLDCDRNIWSTLKNNGIF